MLNNNTSEDLFRQSVTKHGYEVYIPRLFLLAVVLLCAPIAGAETLSFPEAKLRADKVEGNLETSEMRQLIEAQGRLASVAFPHCISRTGSRPTDFTVVVKINSDGQVENSWRQGESQFAKCFQMSMEEIFIFKPPVLPFFTSFEYRNAP